MSRVSGATFKFIRAIASGTLQCACTSTVFTRRPFTTTSRRRVWAWADAASARPQPTNAMPAMAPADSSMNSLRVFTGSPPAAQWAEGDFPARQAIMPWMFSARNSSKRRHAPYFACRMLPASVVISGEPSARPAARAAAIASERSR